jgi:hypothetical protein
MSLSWLNRSVSSESTAVPPYQPRTEARFPRRSRELTVRAPTAPTTPAGLYADADLVTAGLGQVTLLHAEAPARFRNDHCVHLQHGGLRCGEDQLYRTSYIGVERADLERHTAQCRLWSIFRLGRDGELIEIGRCRIEGDEAEEPVYAVKSADRDRTGRFQGPQMIEKPWPPRREIDVRHGLPPARHPNIGKARAIGIGSNPQAQSGGL